MSATTIIFERIRTLEVDADKFWKNFNNMSSLSLLATYDDIIRCQAVLIEDDAEVAFRHFLDSFQEYKAAFLHIQSDNNRLQRELDETITSMSVLETKLSHARRLLEMETR